MKAQRDQLVGIWMSQAEKEKVEQAARAEGRGLSGFGRFHLTHIAEKTLNESQHTAVADLPAAA